MLASLLVLAVALGDCILLPNKLIPPLAAGPAVGAAGLLLRALLLRESALALLKRLPLLALVLPSRLVSMFIVRLAAAESPVGFPPPLCATFGPKLNKLLVPVLLLRLLVPPLWVPDNGESRLALSGGVDFGPPNKLGDALGMGGCLAA